MSTVALESMVVPYVDLGLQHQAIKQEILQAVAEVIDSGKFILGPQVEELEKRFSQICGVKETIALNSGTDALILVLKALGIGPGDEVITVPNSFVASTSCICIVGATPVFVDVGDDYNLDPKQLPKALTHRTKAIIPVHLTGRPVPMDPIMDFAKKHGLHVIEDAAQAVFATYKEKQVGSFGTAGCFSLHPLKNFNACGDGGLVTTDSKDLADQIRLYRNLGLKTRENCVDWSSNSRLDTIQAAILLVKLKYIDAWTKKRRENAAFYSKALKNVPQIKMPIEKKHEMMVYHTFVVLAEKRDELKAFLNEKGVGTAIHYPIPIHKQDVAKEFSNQKFPVAEEQAKHILSLPIHQDLEEEQLHYIAEMIKTFYQKR